MAVDISRNFVGTEVGVVRQGGVVTLFLPSAEHAGAGAGLGMLLDYDAHLIIICHTLLESDVARFGLFGINGDRGFLHAVGEAVDAHGEGLRFAAV